MNYNLELQIRASADKAQAQRGGPLNFEPMRQWSHNHPQFETWFIKAVVRPAVYDLRNQDGSQEMRAVEAIRSKFGSGSGGQVDDAVTVGFYGSRRDDPWIWALMGVESLQEEVLEPPIPLAGWPYFLQSPTRGSWAAELTHDTASFSADLALFPYLTSGVTLRLAGGHIWMHGDGVHYRGVLGAFNDFDGNMAFGSNARDLVFKDGPCEMYAMEQSPTAGWSSGATSNLVIRAFDPAALSGLWASTARTDMLTKTASLWFDDTNIYAAGEYASSDFRGPCRCAWLKADGTFIDNVNLTLDDVALPPGVGKWEPGDEPDYQTTGNIQRPLTLLEDNYIFDKLVYPWTTQSLNNSTGFQAVPPGTVGNFESSYDHVFAWPDLDLFVPALRNAVQLGVYTASTGVRTQVIKGDGNAPDVWEFYTPIVATSTGRLLVRIRRVTYQQLSWNDAKLTVHEVSGPPGARVINYDLDNVAAQGRVCVKTETLFAEYAIATGTLGIPWPATDIKITSPAYVPTGSPVDMGWAEWWGVSRYDPVDDVTTLDWWVPEGWDGDPGNLQRPRDHAVRGPQVAFGNDGLRLNGSYNPFDAGARVWTGISEAVCEDPSVYPSVTWSIPDGAKAIADTLDETGTLHTSQVFPSHSSEPSAGITLSSSVDDKLKFAVQCPTTQIETQYDHPLLFEDRIAYLDPTETLILFPPKLRLDTGDPAIVNESHLEWDAAWHGGSMATNAIGYASIDLAGGDYDNMVRCWIVARTWEGAEEWRHELPIVKSFSNLASSTDGRTFMLYRTSDGDHDTATELRCRIITTATGALLRDYDLGDYPYYPIESVNKGQGSRVLSETLAIHGDRVIMLAGGNAYDLAPA